MTKEQQPYVHLVKDGNGDILKSLDGDIYLKDGMFGEIFMELSSMLNFTYTCKFPPDGQYGAIRPDGTWNGMVGELALGNADIGKTIGTVIISYYDTIIWCHSIYTQYLIVTIFNYFCSFNHLICNFN